MRIDMDGNVFYEIEDGTLATADNSIVQQYTGVKDNKGVEICEGDIVYDYYYNNKKFKDTSGKDKFVVKYYGGSFRLDSTSGCYGGATLSNLACDRDIEIIGNILENPELLEA